MTDTSRPIDPAMFDTGTATEDDFYRHVNGGWLDANPVPAAYGSWGAFHEVSERNQVLLRELLEDAAAKPEGAAARRMAGTYFAAAMDEDAIAK